MARENVSNSAWAKYQAEAEQLPNGASSMKALGWIVDNESIQFLKKEGQRVFWRTQIWRDLEAYRTEAETVPVYVSVLGSHLSPSVRAELPKYDLVDVSQWAARSPSLDYTPASSGTVSASPMDSTSLAPIQTSLRSTKEVLFLTGRASFNIDWSVSVDVHQHLRSAHVVEIKFAGTEWSPVTPA